MLVNSQNSNMEGKNDISEVFLRVFVKELIKIKLGQSKTQFEKKVSKIKQNISIYKSNDNYQDNLINDQINKEITDNKEGTVEIESENSLTSSIAEKDFLNKDNSNLPIPMNLTQNNIIKPINPSPQLIKPVNNFQIRRPLNLQPRQFPIQRMKRIAPPLQIKPNQTPAKRMDEIENFVPSITEQKTDIGIPKIDNILKDPKVMTVECPGPNKPVMIYKNGSIQTSNILLTGDEINNVMKNFSEKTRIPIMSGVFKAAFGNLIVTAVMSDFVGTRFIIQKKPSINQNS